MGKLEKLLTALRNLYVFRYPAYQFLMFRGNENEAFAGSVSAEELPLLEELVSVANRLPGPIIEIGTLFGFTTQNIAQYKEPRKRLITIDDFSWNPVGLSPEAHREFCRRSLHYLLSRGNTELFEGPAAEFYSSYDGERPSLVFIDADHSYDAVQRDISWAVGLNVPIVSGHDFGAKWPGVERAVRESFPSGLRLAGTVWAHVSPSIGSRLSGRPASSGSPR